MKVIWTLFYIDDIPVTNCIHFVSVSQKFFFDYIDYIIDEKNLWNIYSVRGLFVE